MEVFESSSRLGIGNGGVRAKSRRLESGMEEFESNSRFGIGNGRFRAKFRILESGMEKFESSSRLLIGNGGVRVQVEALNRKLNRKLRSSSQLLMLGIGNGRVVYVGSHLIKIALETYTLLPPANSTKEFRPYEVISIVATPLRHSSGSQSAAPNHGNGTCPLRHPH